MKKLILLLSICISNCYAQKGEVTYIKKMSIKIVENSPKKIKNDYIQYANKINNDLKGIKYKLIFNENQSNFQVVDRMEIDKQNLIRLATNIGGGRGVFYTSLKNHEILQQANGFGSLFLISSNLKDYEWEITKDEKKIMGRICYKAVLKKPITQKSKFKTYAWFCPELPFNFGPIGYGNLPGLIIELHLNNAFSFFATKVKLNIKEVKIKKPIKGNKVTKEQFIKIGKDAMSNYNR